MQITDRYLGLLKNALLNEIYIENDVRLLYLFSRILTGQNIDIDVLQNVRIRVPELFAMVKSARQDGGLWWKLDVTMPDGDIQELDLRNMTEFAHTMVGRKRLDNIQHCLSVINSENITGDIAETGVWRGGSTIFMKGCMEAWAMEDRVLWVADSFEGLPVPTLPQDAGHDFSITKAPILAVTLDEVRENFRRYDLLDERVKFIKGWFRDTLHEAPIQRLALLRLDGDLYESTRDSLRALYAKVVPGGFIIVDDFNDFEPCRRAVLEFREQHKISDPMQQIDWSASFWRKSTSTDFQYGVGVGLR